MSSCFADLVCLLFHYFRVHFPHDDLSYILLSSYVVCFIKVVQISGIDITDEEAMLFARLSKLKEIDMYECGTIGDTTVIALATQCHSIESLTLGGSLRR